MKNKVIDAISYRFSPTDKIVFDANILVSLFSDLEPPDSRPVLKYSQVLKLIRQANAQILLDVLVMSEYVNVCVKKHYNLALSQGDIYDNPKKFRQSAKFPAIASGIAASAKKIVEFSKPIDHPFSQWPINDILNEYSAGQSDLNDQFIVELCQKEKALLLTNDADFTKGGITVLTTNTKLLAACS